MKIYKKTILPLGFMASGISCGIKKSGKPDLALFATKAPAKASGMFTTNKILAAPVILCKNILKKNKAFNAIVVNSGNANCFTGLKGLRDAQDTAVLLAKALGTKKERVLVSSTGIIGKKLPLDKIKHGIPELIDKLSCKGGKAASKAIMTTDTFPKEVTVKFLIKGKPVSICAVAKGAGMISPDMATLLVFILTDANISQGALNRALKESVNNSFNSITIDGCMSTNDSVIILANGMACNNKINKGAGFDIFKKALSIASLELAKMIVRDGEGATKFIQIKVSEAKDLKQAKTAALAIANSNLFKTAVYGKNPNFGRIAAAVGASKVDVSEKSLKIKVSSLIKKNVFVDVSLGRGNSSSVVYTSDLTPEYIKINAEYN